MRTVVVKNWHSSKCWHVSMQLIASQQLIASHWDAHNFRSFLTSSTTQSHPETTSCFWRHPSSVIYSPTFPTSPQTGSPQQRPSRFPSVITPLLLSHADDVQRLCIQNDQLWTMKKFLTYNPNSPVPIITAVTINLHMEILQWQKPHKLSVITNSSVSINRHSSLMRRRRRQPTWILSLDRPSPRPSQYLHNQPLF